MDERNFLENKEIKSEDLKEKAIDRFEDIYSSDREMVEGPVFPRLSTLLSKLTIGRSREIGNIWIDFKFSKNAAKSLKDTMIEHDQENLEKTYVASGLFHALFFIHVSLEDRIEAGFNFAEALFEKDKLEEKYRGSEGKLN